MAKKTATKKTTTKSSSRKKSDIRAEFDLLDDCFVSSEEKENKEKEAAAEEAALKEEFKKKSLSPFDIMKMMFYERHAFDKIPDDVLKANYFIINRRFAIMFPQQAAKLSMMGINEAQVIRFWANFMKAKGYSKFPNELYIKAEKNGIAKVGIEDLDDDVLASYMKRYNLSRRDLTDMLKFYNQQTIEEIKRYVSIYSPDEQMKLFAKEKGSKKKFENDDD